MTRAFVLSGGGSLGSVQVGMLAALAELGDRAGAGGGHVGGGR